MHATAGHRRARSAPARPRRRRGAGLLLRRRLRGDHVDECAALGPLERARACAAARLEPAAQGHAVRPDRPAGDRRARLRRPATRPRAAPEPPLHLRLLGPARGTRIVSPGEFRTAPRPSDPQTIRFAISGDADGARDPKTGKPAYNVFQVYGRMAAERNHFNINLGDTIYSDSEVGGVPPALTVPAKWRKYKQNLGFGHLRNLRRTTGLYSHWDDHEFINDFSRAEHGEVIYRAGRTAFTRLRTGRLHEPRRPLPDVPLGQAPRAVLPRRALVPLGEGPAICGSDLAPTAPQPVRNAFAALVPALANPVPQACLDALADPCGRCSARASTPRSRRRSAPRRRRGRSSSTRSRSSSSTRFRTTAGRATPPSATGCSASCRRT